MANILYDFAPGAVITPYVGAGAGIAFVDPSLAGGCTMRRCLANLIGNAQRHARTIAVAATALDDGVEITIDDDGPGIPADKREDVFRPFVRLDPSRNSETGGIGLGLTIARDVARSHGGDLELLESPQGGLRARLWLPV